LLCSSINTTYLDGQYKGLSRAQTVAGKHFEPKGRDFHSTGMDLVKHFLLSQVNQNQPQISFPQDHLEILEKKIFKAVIRTRELTSKGSKLSPIAFDFVF
uniref:Uncharacterized protein n=1 Tax=Strix occidentalis caurina TaxID=311401 RepID=A0A8D0F103_STROC